MCLSYAGDAREERRQGTVAPRTTGALTFLPAVTGWDPEEARPLLDPVLERMMAAVHRYDGTVNQVMGDGIMAIDSPPTARILLLVDYRPKVISLLERGLKLRQAANIPFSFHRIALPLDAVYALSEGVAEAVPPLEQTVEQAAPAGRGAGSDGPDRSALR
jgi:class 3 adenylate cyclase